MPLNYKSTKEADGTFTIHDVDAIQLGTWRGSIVGEDGKPKPFEFEVKEEHFEKLLEADQDIRATTGISPILKSNHRNHETGVDGMRLGELGPFKRVGDKLKRSIAGITESLFRQMETGNLGNLSPDIVPFLNRVSGKTHELFMRALSFTGANFPAMQGLIPLASHEFEAAFTEEILSKEIQLHTFVGETQGAAGGEPAERVSFGDRPKPQGETPKPQEVEMAEDTGAQALRDKELAFEAKETAFEEKMRTQTLDLRKRELTTAWGGIVGVTADPKDETMFTDVGMGIEDDDLRKSHIDSWKTRPAIEPKKTTPTGSNPQEEAKDERCFADRMFDRAVQMVDVDRTAATIPEAFRKLELAFTEDEQKEYDGYYKENFPVERVGK